MILNTITNRCFSQFKSCQRLKHACGIQVYTKKISFGYDVDVKTNLRNLNKERCFKYYELFDGCKNLPVSKSNWKGSHPPGGSHSPMPLIIPFSMLSIITPSIAHRSERHLIPW